MRLDADSSCLSIGQSLAAKPKHSGFVVDQRSEPTLAIATDAVSIPTTRVHQSGGIAEAGTREGREGSIPSSTTAHMNNDRVVQRRRAGQRSHKSTRAAISSCPARSGGTLAPTLFTSLELLRHGLDSFDSICWAPMRAFFFCFGDGVG